VGRSGASAVEHQFVKPNLHSKLVERVATNKFAAKSCEEAFLLVGIALVEDVGNHSTQHRIAQILQSLIVDMLCPFLMERKRLVHQRRLVERNVVW